MARTATPVTSEDVREWARGRNWQDERGNAVADRGRMPSSLIADYNKAHPARKYEAGVARTARVAPSAPAPRQTRSRTATETVQPQGIPVMAPGGTDNEAASMAASVIEALKSAASTRRGSSGGQPTLVTVTAQQLAYV